MLKPDALYKIVVEQDFDAGSLDHCIRLSVLDEQSGFMHLSFGRQVQNTITKFFQGAQKVAVVEIDPEELARRGTLLRVESNKPGGESYPHLYGTQKIPLSAVKKIFWYQNGQREEGSV